MAVERIQLMKVPIDILNPEDIEEVAMDLLKKEGIQQIVFLTLWDFLKARRNNEFRELVLNASLVLPVSKSLVSAARFLKLNTPVRRRSFDVIIDFLNALESHYKSAYLLGARKEILQLAEKNVRSTFPHLKILGRFTGFYNKTLEDSIVTAIAKANPEMTIVSNGIKGGALWINKHRTRFSSGLFVYDRDILDIFANNKKLISESVFKSGFDYVIKVFKNPLRIFNIFRYLRFKLLVLGYRLFKRNT